MSSRKDQKAELRAEREQREREAAAAERRRRTIGYVVGGALALAAVVAIAAVLLSGGGGSKSSANSSDWPKGSVPAQQISDLAAAAKAAGCQTKNPPDEGNQHVQGPVKYKANPPTSGNHFIEPAADGAYLEAPRKEQTVHTLEHGRIEIQFKPSVPSSVKGDLKALFDEDPYHMMIFPNQTNMPYAVAATAWDHQLVCPAYSDKVPDAIRAFKSQYRDRAPESVP